MAWDELGSLRGPQGPAPDTSEFVQQTEVAATAAAGKVVKRLNDGNIALPVAGPSTASDAVSKAYLDGRVPYTFVTQSSAPGASTPATQITFVTG